ncbi:MAG: ABC transporter permease, partial [Oscillospiraceae bacterium]
MKFLNLLKKELREMLTVQTIATLVILVAVLSLAGKGLSGVIEDAAEDNSTITICDKDNTDFSEGIIHYLIKSTPNDLQIVTLESDNYVKELKRLDLNNVVIIPEGFTDQVRNKEKAQVKYVGTMTSLSSVSAIGTDSDTVLSIIENAVKSQLYAEKIASGKMTASEIAQLDYPIEVTETTIVGDKSADVAASILFSLCQMQGMFVPIIVFLLIMYSSQMLLNAISTEKLDKTLETLLSAPVSRMSVLSAKMLASAIVAAIMAVAFMFGMNNMTSAFTTGADTSQLNGVLEELGLTLSVSQYVLIGLQMFVSVLIGLSLSLVLGALAKDIKSAQTLVMPILFSAMIPYILSIMLDIKTLPTLFRYLVYAIPFTHTFMSSENVMFGNMGLYWGGLAYQLVILAISMTFAIKVFTSDKIFTMTLSIGEKKKKRKLK